MEHCDFDTLSNKDARRTKTGGDSAFSAVLEKYNCDIDLYFMQ